MLQKSENKKLDPMAARVNDRKRHVEYPYNEPFISTSSCFYQSILVTFHTN